MEVFKVFCARGDQDHVHQWKTLAFRLLIQKSFLYKKLEKMYQS